MNRNTIAAQKIRQELLQKLGAFCVWCGEDDPEELEFDHIFGRSYNANKLSYRQRMIQYRRESELNLIRVLCGDCNKQARKKAENGSFVRTEDTALKTMDMPF